MTIYTGFLVYQEAVADIAPNFAPFLLLPKPTFLMKSLETETLSAIFTISVGLIKVINFDFVFLTANITSTA